MLLLSSAYSGLIEEVPLIEELREKEREREFEKMNRELYFILLSTSTVLAFIARYMTESVTKICN